LQRLEHGGVAASEAEPSHVGRSHGHIGWGHRRAVRIKWWSWMNAAHSFRVRQPQMATSALMLGSASTHDSKSSNL
jgi:hypothetical protein